MNTEIVLPMGSSTFIDIMRWLIMNVGPQTFQSSTIDVDDEHLAYPTTLTGEGWKILSYVRLNNNGSNRNKPDCRLEVFIDDDVLATQFALVSYQWR